MNDHPPPLLVSCREAAKRLAISERKLWSLTAPRGPILAVRIGTAVRYSVATLHEFIARAEQESMTSAPTGGEVSR